MPSASVSEIHLCHRCPRLLAYQRIGKKNAWKVGLSGTDEMPGTFFHDRIAAPFYKKMAAGGNTKIIQKLAHALSKSDDEEREKYLLAFLEKHFFIPAIAKYAKRFQSLQIIGLGRGLELWNRCLIRFFNQLDPVKEPGDWKALLKKCVHDPEVVLRVNYGLNEGIMLQVTGRYDALMLNPDEGKAIIVEFKGRKAWAPDEDFLQVALYAWLFRHKTGIFPNACVIYLEEDDPEIFYDAKILRNADSSFPNLFTRVSSIIQAVPQKGGTTLPSPPSLNLCPHCPFDGICDSDWGKRCNEPVSMGDNPENFFEEKKAAHNGDRTVSHLSAKENSEEADEGLKRLCSAFESLKLPVDAMGYIVGPRFIRYKVKPIIEKGSTAKKLKNQAENIQVEMGIPMAPMIQPQAGFVSVDVPRENSEPLTLGDVWRIGAKNRPDSSAAFPMGMAIDGSIFWADLTDPNMTGILVGGASGSGKSVFLRAAVIGLALNAAPEQIGMTLIDPKRVSFTDLTDLPHLDGPVIMDEEIAIETLESLIHEMEHRYRRFEEKKVQDIGHFNRISKPMAHHVVIIDEYGDLMVHKDKKAELEKSVQRLGQKGRAAGIHIVLATQRPDAKVVTPIIKANLALKVALKVTTASNSSIILDQTGAEYLIGTGDMLIGGSLFPERLQGPLTTGTEIRRAMGSDNA